MKLVDSAVSDRAADHTTGDKTIGSSCNCNGGSVLNAHFLKERSEGTSSSVSADQRDGTHSQTQSSVKAEQLCAESADKVLDAAHHDCDDEELDNADTTLLQFTEGSHVTYGAEECGHEYGLKCGVQAELHNAHGTKNYMNDSEDKTSDYRCRDAVASQKLNPSNQHTANQQHYYCECECLIHIKL